MKLKLLDYMVCPKCGDRIELRGAVYEQGEVKSGVLICITCSTNFPIEDFIPRFVPKENYAANFGLQWNHFERTQLDKYNGTTLSRDRFYRETGWSATDLKGCLVLEAGCGAGRFTEVCLEAGAEVVTFDLSDSVEACLENHGLRENLHVVQADIYQLPFRKRLFQRIFCLGVLQHTPRPKESFLNLVTYLQNDGHIAIDVYRKGIWDWLLPKHYLRLVTTRISHRMLFDIISYAAAILIPLSDLLGKIPSIGFYLRRIIPVSNIRGYAPMSEELIKEWAILDTFDMLGAKYDQPQSPTEIRRWFEQARLSDIDVSPRRTLVIGRARYT